MWLRTTLRCLHSDACSQGSARPQIRCHEKDCNSRIYGGVTHVPHVHQQCRQDTLSTNPRIPPIHQDQHLHQNGFRPDTGKNRPARSHQARRDRTGHSAKCSLANELCYLTYFLLRLRDQDHISGVLGATEHDNPQRPRDQSETRIQHDSLIFTRTTSIGNFRSGFCSPSSVLHSKARQAGDFHTDSDTVLGFFQILVR